MEMDLNLKIRDGECDASYLLRRISKSCVDLGEGTGNVALIVWVNILQSELDRVFGALKLAVVEDGVQ